MCLYPRLLKNRKYTANKKNGGVIPPILDDRVKQVPIGCGRCIECCKQKANEWRVRLYEEIKTTKNGKFTTLTFSEEALQKLASEIQANGYELDNAIATLAVRRFLERWRKEFKKSVKHWLITELGHTGTERIHLHGIIWTSENWNTIERIWKYGWIWKGYGNENYVNERTINYITKYITKRDEKHKNFKGKILTSPGMGAGYIGSANAEKNKYKAQDTREYYKAPTGQKQGLPIYYRNKIYSEEEREKLWLQKLDKNERWICGEKINATNEKEYFGLLEYYREKNKRLGYGDDNRSWDEEEYKRQQLSLRR